MRRALGGAAFLFAVLIAGSAEARIGWCPVSITDGRTVVPLNLSPGGEGPIDEFVDRQWNGTSLRYVKCWYGSSPVPALNLVVTWLWSGAQTNDRRTLDGTCGPWGGGPGMNSRTRQALVNWNGGMAGIAPPHAQHLLGLAEGDALACPSPSTGMIACNAWDVRLEQPNPVTPGSRPTSTEWRARWVRAPFAPCYQATWESLSTGQKIVRGVCPRDEGQNPSYWSEDGDGGRITYYTGTFGGPAGEIRGQYDYRKPGIPTQTGSWIARCYDPGPFPAPRW
jgi:hypothetical protein